MAAALKLRQRALQVCTRATLLVTCITDDAAYAWARGPATEGALRDSLENLKKLTAGPRCIHFLQLDARDQRSMPKDELENLAGEFLNIADAVGALEKITQRTVSMHMIAAA